MRSIGRAYRRAFSGLPREVWLLSAAVLVPVVDRGGTVAALAAAAGIAFHPLVTAPDLGFPYEKDAEAAETA